MPQSDSGSSDGSWSRGGPGIPSSPKAVNVNGSTASPGAVMNVASAVAPCSMPAGVPEAVVVLGAGRQAAQAGVHEELVGFSVREAFEPPGFRPRPGRA